MKKVFLVFFVFSLTVCAIFASENSDTLQSTGILKIGWYDQYPFTYEKNVLGVNTITGMDIELSKAVAKKLDLNLKFIEESWGGQLQMLKNGKIDVMLSGLVSPERFKDFRISDSIRKECTVIYTRKDIAENINFKTTESFLNWIQQNNFKIGITKGNIYTDNTTNSFISNPKNSKYIKAARCDFINLKNLKNNHVVAVLVDRTAGASIVNVNNWEDDLVSHYYPKFKISDVCYMLSKKTTTAVDLKKINSAINSLKNEGEYKTIVKSYLFPVILNLTVNTSWYFYIVLAGTIAFCLCALRMVLKENQSLIGTLIFVTIYTVGGGGLRDILTGRYPVFFVRQPVYIYTIFIIILGVFIITNLYRYVLRGAMKNKILNLFQKVCKFAGRFFIKYIFDIVDSIGLAAFVVFGVIVALEVKAYPLILWGPILAMITTSGGGIVCNMLRSHKFDRTMKNMFTEIAAVWGLVLSILLNHIAEEAVMHKILIAVLVTVIGAFFTRWIVCYFKIPSIHYLFVKWTKSSIKK